MSVFMGVALIPVTGDDIVNKAAARQRQDQEGSSSLCSVDDRMEALLDIFVSIDPSQWKVSFCVVIFFTAHHKGIGTLLAAPPRARHLGCYDAVSQIHFGSLDTVRCFEYTNYPASGLIHILTDCRL